MPSSQLPALLQRYLHGKEALAQQCRNHFPSGLLTAGLLGAAISNPVMAQTAAIDNEDAADWFQIELVVFTQPDAKLTQEYWNEQLQPTYADDPILLLPTRAPKGVEFVELPIADPQQSDPVPAAPNDSEVVVANADQPASLSVPSLIDSHATLAPLSGRQLPDLYSFLYPQPLATSPSATSWPQQLPLYYQDGAFSLLSAKQLAADLKQEAENATQNPTANDKKPALAPINLKRLQKKGHRILFHANWRQPVVDLKQSQPILIRGGDPLGPKHFELEGDIKVSLNRYLHLWPQLYLTVPLPQDWQPRDPRTVEALATAQQLQLEQEREQELEREREQQQLLLETQALAAAQQSTAEAIVGNDPLTPSENGITIATGSSLFSNTAAPASAAVTSMPSDEVAQSSEPIARYLTVKMDKPRRMRSRELHYLDHPVFGLLIRITPYRLPPPVVVVPAITEPAIVEPAVTEPGVTKPALSEKKTGESASS
ncbi:MAG: CsiV family protein [Motiliproteus sp.]